MKRLIAITAIFAMLCTFCLGSIAATATTTPTPSPTATPAPTPTPDNDLFYTLTIAQLSDPMEFITAVINDSSKISTGPYYLKDMSTTANLSAALDSAETMSPVFSDSRDLLGSQITNLYNFQTAGNQAMTDIAFKMFINAAIDENANLQDSSFPNIVKYINSKAYSYDVYVSYLNDLGNIYNMAKATPEKILYVDSSGKLAAYPDAVPFISGSDLALPNVDKSVLTTLFYNVLDYANKTASSTERSAFEANLSANGLVGTAPASTPAPTATASATPAPTSTGNIDLAEALVAVRFETPSSLAALFKTQVSGKSAADANALAATFAQRAGSINLNANDFDLMTDQANLTLSDAFVAYAAQNESATATLLNGVLSGMGITPAYKKTVLVDLTAAQTININSVLPSGKIAALNASGIDNFAVKNGEVTVTVDTASLNSAIGSGTYLSLDLNKSNGNDLPLAINKVLGENKVYTIRFIDKSGVSINSKLSGFVTIDKSALSGLTLTADNSKQSDESGNVTAAQGFVSSAGSITLSLTSAVYYSVAFDQTKVVPVNTGGGTGGPKTGFSDVASDNWAVQYIAKMVALNVLSGYPDKTFKPNDNVTREQFVKILIAGFGFIDNTATAKFSDVATTAWYYKPVAIANKLGIVKGNGAGGFGVGALITRQDMAVMVYRAAKLANIKLTKVNQLINFSDQSGISPYASDAVSTLQQAGIINGLTSSTFAPGNNATRAQAATIICKLVTK